MGRGRGMSKTRYPRADVIRAIKPICEALADVTEKLIVAGSLRRMKEDVGDAEILFIPRIADRPDPDDLLGNLVATDLARLVINGFIKKGVLAKRKKENGTHTWGAQNMLAVHVATGIPVDFFQCNRANWWTLLVCRTGSKENNERICNAAIEKRLRWNPYQGFEDRMTGELIHVPRSEQDVFERVGLPFLEPRDR